jgi:hypothetical protein
MEEQIKTNSRTISKDVSDLVETYVALAKANVSKKAATAVSASVAVIIMAVFACFLILFAALGLAWWLGQLLSSMIAGFLIVSAFFALLLILFIAFKEQLLYPIVRNEVVKKLYE